MSESIRNADSSAEGFPPILGAEPRVLILGSLPSRKSLDQRQYYGHPQNAFWKIMRTLLGARGSYDERSAAIAAAGVAVWDVLARAVRPGSMDADIDMGSAVANPLGPFLEREASVGLVAFNGRAAESMFRRFVPGPLRPLEYVRLPSTSPAYASLTLAEKTERWRTGLASALPALDNAERQMERSEQ